MPGFGEAAFVQAAGFLKIADGDNPLDATWIHPESYDVAEQVLEQLECTPADLADKETAAQIAERAAQRRPRRRWPRSWTPARCCCNDILAQLARPGRDPREDLPPPIFKKGVIKLDDLTPGMELTGTVLNVVDFGAFVDIGLHDTGLVHISQLANRYVRDPHEVVSVGDIVKVWVHEIDKTRRRVSLTMIAPGTQRTPPPQARRNGKRPGQAAPQRPARRQQPAAGSRTAQPPRRGRQAAAPPDRRPTRRRPPHSAAASVAAGSAPARHAGRDVRPAEASSPHRKPHAKPKPVVPLTNEMKAGKAPLRTFGDLKQFFELAGARAEPPAGRSKSARRWRDTRLEKRWHPGSSIAVANCPWIFKSGWKKRSSAASGSQDAASPGAGRAGAWAKKSSSGCTRSIGWSSRSTSSSACEQLPQHFPGFRFETLVGDAGLGRGDQPR